MIKINFDSHQVTAWLTKAEKKQLPFVTSYALNKTAWDARDKIKSHVRNEFNVRKNWVLNSIRVEKSNKRQRHIHATIYTISKVLALHEEGGLIRSGRSRFTIPLWGTRRTKTGSIGNSKRPAALRGKKNVRLLQTKRGPVLFKVTRKRKTPLWGLEDEIRLRPRLRFEKTVADTANAVMAKNFKTAWKWAMDNQR